MTSGAKSRFLAEMFVLSCIVAIANVTLYDSRILAMPTSGVLYITLWFLVLFILCVGIIGGVIQTSRTVSGHREPTKLDYRGEERFKQRLETFATNLEEEERNRTKRARIRILDFVLAEPLKPSKAKDVNVIAPLFKHHWDTVPFGESIDFNTWRQEYDVPATTKVQTKALDLSAVAPLFEHHCGPLPIGEKAIEDWHQKYDVTAEFQAQIKTRDISAVAHLFKYH